MTWRKTRIRPYDPSRDKMWDEVPPIRDTSRKIESMQDVSPKEKTIPEEEVAKALGGKVARGRTWRDKAS